MCREHDCNVRATLEECPADSGGRLLANTFNAAKKLKDDLPVAMRVFGTLGLTVSYTFEKSHAALALLELVLLATQVGDAVWKQALLDCIEARTAKASVMRELPDGGDICAATL